MKGKCGKPNQCFYIQVREPPAPLNIPIPTPVLSGSLRFSYVLRVSTIIRGLPRFHNRTYRLHFKRSATPNMLDPSENEFRKVEVSYFRKCCKLQIPQNVETCRKNVSNTMLIFLICCTVRW